MTCHWCDLPARHLVTGQHGKRRACNQHLERAQREAGTPRITESLELGLPEPGSGT